MFLYSTLGPLEFHLGIGALPYISVALEPTYISTTKKHLYEESTLTKGIRAQYEITVICY